MKDVQVGDTFELRAMPGVAWEVLELALHTAEGRIARLETGDKWTIESETRLLADRGSWVRVEHVLETVTA